MAKAVIVQIVLLVALLVGVVEVRSEQPTPTWEKTYGSGTLTMVTPEFWSGYYLMQTSDGGFLACGPTPPIRKYAPSGRGVLKTSSDGTEQWRAVVGDTIRAVLGSFVYENVTTSTYEFLGCLSSGLGVQAGLVYFMEFSAKGDTIRSRYTYSEEGATSGVPLAVQQTRDGNVILAAAVGLGPGQNKEFLLAKADKQGKKLWERRFVGKYEGFTGLNAVVQTSDGGYAFCAYSSPLSGTTASMVVIRTDAEGKQQWQYSYDERFDVSADVQETPDGGFLLLANQYRTNPYQRVVHLIKLDKEGKQEWERFIEKGEILNGNSLLLHPNGSLFIAGYSAVYENRQIGKVSTKSYDSYLAKVGWDGKVEWEVNAVSPEAFDLLRKITLTRDGGIAVVGQRNDSLYLAKYPSSVVSSVVAAAGQLEELELLVQASSAGESVELRYRLPARGVVRVEVVDGLGRRVSQMYDGVAEVGEQSLRFSTRGYSAGVYFVRVVTSHGSGVQKFVVQR